MLKKDKGPLMQILRSTQEFKPVEVAVAEELIDGYLEDAVGYGYYVLIAESDPTLLGYICYGPTPLTEGTWDIYWMAVAKESQGKGIGGALLEAAEGEIGEVQGRLVIIETSATPEYEKTRRFYLGRGYEVIASIPDFYAPGDGKVMFQKKLKYQSSNVK